MEFLHTTHPLFHMQLANYAAVENAKKLALYRNAAYMSAEKKKKHKEEILKAN